MTKKNIILSENFIPNITNIEEIQKETQNIISSIYNRFMNETNYNNYEETKKALSYYRYIPKDTIIPNNRMIKYLNMDNPLNLKLQYGGKLWKNNKYNFVFFRHKLGAFNLDRKNVVCFYELNDDEILRCKLESML